MTKAEYEQLGQLLLRLKQHEQKVLDSNPHGPLYLAFVDRELFQPIDRVLELAQVRVKQVED